MTRSWLWLPYCACSSSCARPDIIPQQYQANSNPTYDQKSERTLGGAARSGVVAVAGKRQHIRLHFQRAWSKWLDSIDVWLSHGREVSTGIRSHRNQRYIL